MKLLACDQGSIKCGLAAFNGENVVGAWEISARATLPPKERLVIIGRRIRDLAEVLAQGGRQPDVIAIEDVVFGKSIASAVTMGETRGYLMATFGALWPNARIIDVHPAKTKAALGVSQRRTDAKSETIRLVSAILGRPAGEDEADAVAIGMAARAALFEEDLHRRA